MQKRPTAIVNRPLHTLRAYIHFTFVLVPKRGGGREEEGGGSGGERGKGVQGGGGRARHMPITQANT